MRKFQPQKYKIVSFFEYYRFLALGTKMNLKQKRPKKRMQKRLEFRHTL